MAEKFSIHFDEPLIAATAGHEEQISSRVNLIAHEWLKLVSANIPNFSESEWFALSVVDGIADIEDDAILEKLWAIMEDAKGECNVFDVKPMLLASKLRALTITQLYALRETLRRLNKALDQGQTMQAALINAGAITVD